MAILDIGKKLTVILQYLPAAVVFGFSLSFWIEGWILSALMMGLIGIGLTLRAVFLNAIRKFPGNENRYVIVVAVMIFCVSLYILITGDIYIGIILILVGIFFIFAHFLHLQKNAGSKWSTPIWQIYIPIGASLITFGPLFYLEISSDKSHTVGKESGVQRMTVDKSSILNRGSKRKASTSASPSVKKAVNLMTQFITPDQAKDPTVQKLMKIVESESFQEQLERQNPKTLDDMLQLLVAHGLTEAGEIDVADIIAQNQRSLEAEYKAKNPNQAPEEEDDEMAERFAVAINQFGGLNGVKVFATNRENAEWMMLRFNEAPEAYREWMNLVRRRVESGKVSDVSPTSELRNVANPSPSTENEPTDFVTESEPTEAWEESTISNTEVHRARTAPLVESEKVKSKAPSVAPSVPVDARLAPTLREQFSVEDIERARSAPEEEGLSHLKEYDPDVDEQVEELQSRDEDSK